MAKEVPKGRKLIVDFLRFVLAIHQTGVPTEWREGRIDTNESRLSNGSWTKHRKRRGPYQQSTPIFKNIARFASEFIEPHVANCDEIRGPICSRI